MSCELYVESWCDCQYDWKMPMEVVTPNVAAIRQNEERTTSQARRPPSGKDIAVA